MAGTAAGAAKTKITNARKVAEKKAVDLAKMEQDRTEVEKSRPKSRVELLEERVEAAEALSLACADYIFHWHNNLHLDGVYDRLVDRRSSSTERRAL